MRFSVLLAELCVHVHEIHISFVAKQNDTALQKVKTLCTLISNSANILTFRQVTPICHLNTFKMLNIQHPPALSALNYLL